MLKAKNSKELSAQFFGEQAPKLSHVQLFKDLEAQPDNVQPMERSLLLLSTPRCGSTLFSEALNNCGRLGRCDEWLNTDYFRAYFHLFGKFKLSEYISFVERKTLRNTGVFCLKIHTGQLIEMITDPDLGLGPLIPYHFVYLYRRDKLAQAVSFCKAKSSKQFRSYEEATPPVVNRQGISSALDSIIGAECFAREHLTSHVDASYAYEDFRQLSTESTRADKSYSEVLKALGKEHPKGYSYQFTAGNLKKQADAQSRKAIADFQAYILGEKE
jgi:LPS sulfotransferase NodH